MEPRDERVRERLLSHLPRPANLAAYQEEVTAMLGKKEKELRRERRVLIELWIFVIVVSVPFLWMGAERFGSKAVDEAVMGPYFMGLVGFWFLFGMVYFVAHTINRSKLEILKEVKQAQVQVLELHALLRKDDVRTP